MMMSNKETLQGQKLPMGRFPLRKREYGGIQPFIPLGPFKVRLPFIHYGWEWTECFAAMFLGVACLGAGVAITMDVLGVSSFEIALTFGVLNALCYALPAHLGDPVVPGWITPALPLTIGYVTGYAMGPERIHAMIALQLLVAILFFVMGATGFGKKLVSAIPISLRGGILLGAGFAAALNVMNVRLQIAPITIILSTVIAYFFLFSKTFLHYAEKHNWVRILRNQGIVPAQIFAIIVGPYLLKELPMPEIVWGFTPLNFGHVLKNYTVFGIGFPDLKLFIAAIPMALTAYIIAFGDFILAKEIVDDASGTREDETVEFDATRSNLVSALRNGIMGLLAPWVPMNGPLWASGLLTITERYKMGYKTLPSYWGGVGTFRAATVIAVMLMPLVTLIRPAFGIFFALTMVVQAFACGYIGMKMLTDNQQRGIALAMGSVLAIKGASIGLLSGVILYFIIEHKFTPKVVEQELPKSVSCG
jgi:hypothetical protein